MHLCVLTSLVDRSTYGNAIAAHLEREGLGEVKGGTLHPLLGPLEADALLAAAGRLKSSGSATHPSARIGEVLAEVDSHCADRGSFGTQHR